MSTDSEQAPKRSYARIAFLGCGLVALLFLGYKSYTFVQEARVAVNIGRDSTDRAHLRIVNKSEFTPPANGKLRLQQLEMMMHIIQATDTLAAKSPEFNRTNRIVELLNEYTVSLEEYRWIRSMIAKATSPAHLRSRSGGDEFGIYKGLLLQDFVQRRSFFTDSLDKQLL